MKAVAILDQIELPAICVTLRIDPVCTYSLRPANKGTSRGWATNGEGLADPDFRIACAMIIRFFSNNGAGKSHSDKPHSMRRQFENLVDFLSRMDAAHCDRI